jgi:hypothetical protein
MDSSLISRAWVSLKIALGSIAIISGVDKFLNMLTVWKAYIAPVFAGPLGQYASEFMMAAGVIEILAGVAILTAWTKNGAYVIAAWVTLVSINLLFAGFYDLLLRDVIVVIAALSLGWLTEAGAGE